MKKLVAIMLALSFASIFTIGAQARLLGDVNSDNKTNSQDALMVLKYSVGNLDSIDTKRADVNGDGRINSSDALIILKISVGSYTGDIEIDDELVTSFTADTVDPIIKTGTYTMKLSMTSDGTTLDPTIEVDGNNIAVSMTVKYGLLPIEVTILVKDGKTYAVMPSLKMYFDTQEDLSSINTSQVKEKAYLKSEYATIDGVKYVCESFKTSDGQFVNYYFLDGKWKIFESEAGNAESRQNVISLAKGVRTSSFDLTGYTYGGNLADK